MEIKDLINSIIKDLIDDAPISKIMLKAQAIASNLGNDKFAEWIKREQNGYGNYNDIPEYRKSKCQAKVNMTKGFDIITNFDVPIDAIPDEKTREMLSYICFSEPISEIDNMSKNASPSGALKVIAPAYAYKKTNEIFPYCNVDALWKVTNVTAASSVVDKFKSKMLDFFLELDKKLKLGIDFNNLEGKKEVAQVVNQTITAGIYLSGTGDVSVSNSTIGANVNVDGLDKNLMISLIKQIRECHELDDNEDAVEELSSIEEELNKKEFQPKLIKKSFLFLKEIAVNAGANVAAQAIIRALGLM